MLSVLLAPLFTDVIDLVADFVLLFMVVEQYSHHYSLASSAQCLTSVVGSSTNYARNPITESKKGITLRIRKNFTLCLVDGNR